MNDYWWSAMRTLFVFLLGVGMTALAYHITYPTPIEESAVDLAHIVSIRHHIDTVYVVDTVLVAWGANAERSYMDSVFHVDIDTLPRPNNWYRVDTVYIVDTVFIARRFLGGDGVAVHRDTIHSVILIEGFSIDTLTFTDTFRQSQIKPNTDSVIWAPFEEDK